MRWRSWRAIAVVAVALAALAPSGAGAAPSPPGHHSCKGGAPSVIDVGPTIADDAQNYCDEHGGGQGGGGGGASEPVAPATPSTQQAPNTQQRVGTVNPLSIRNPFCDAGGLEQAERRNCRVTGTPEGRYPTSNYGFDVHIDTGVDNISGNFASMIAQIANAIWTFCLFVLNIVLTVLGWAFSLSPFTDNSAMRELDSGLERFYGAFTEPWLVVAMVAIGAVALYRGIVRREVSQTIGATVLSVALMVLALWVIHEPRQTIGTLTGYVNDAAVNVLAAPQSGSVSNPVGDYGQATDEVWREMTLPGFSVLNFSNVEWALSKPDPELLETANRYACADAAYLAQLPPNRVGEIVFGSEHTGGVAGVGGSDHTICENLGEIAPAPRTNAEIWLRNSPGSLARERLWDQHTDEAPYSSYLAIQGEGGAATRLPLVLLIALGLLGGILLLSWIAMRLFMQTAVAFVLVLMTPLALFLPAFGEGGRRGFAAWGSTLIGALVSKLVYAALLSVVLLATTVIGSLVDGTGGVGATMAFLAMAALWWAVFLYRNTLLAFLSVSDESTEGHGRLAGALGIYSMARLGQRVVGGGGGLRRADEGRLRAAKDRLVGDRRDRREATGAVARGDLDSRASRRLDSRLAADERMVGDQRNRREELADVSKRRTRALADSRKHSRAAERVSDPAARARHERAREGALERAAALRDRQASLRSQIAAAGPAEREAGSFIAAARNRERAGGRRWSREDLGGARNAIRAEGDRPVSDPAHAWRVGMTPDRYRALSGAERERVHADVSQQLRADRAAFGAIPDRAEGEVGRRASGRYRRQVLARRGGEQRLHAERTAATRRRRAAHRRARRGVSR